MKSQRPLQKQTAEKKLNIKFAEKGKSAVAGSGCVDVSIAVLPAQHIDVLGLDVDMARVKKINNRRDIAADAEIEVRKLFANTYFVIRASFFHMLDSYADTRKSNELVTHSLIHLFHIPCTRSRVFCGLCHVWSP